MTTGVRARASAPVGIGLAVTLAGCSVLFDPSTPQCSSDQDCAPVHAVCDLRGGICVPPVIPKVTVTVSPPGTAADAAGAASVDAGIDAGGAAGDPAATDTWPCTRTNKPVEAISANITTNRRLTCERDYLLMGSVAVKAGAVLTIDPGTTVLGDTASKGRLSVEPGARLLAAGLRMSPIVFTSNAAPAMRRAGDWGGVVLLGRAPTATTAIDAVGLRQGDDFGGFDAIDDSGVLRFVRIEYAGGGLANSGGSGALTLAAVGRGTTLDNVQVRQSGQDCFKFVGGTVGGKHLVCQGSLRNGFDWESGYRGKLQFLVVQQTPHALDGGGFVVRNGLPAAVQVTSEPIIYNATLCGRAIDVAGEQYGILIAGGAGAHVSNALVAGFEVGIDVRGVGTMLDVRNSMFWLPVAYGEDGSNPTYQSDDDAGLDEGKQILEPARKNAVGRPNFGDCFEPNRIGFAPSPAMRTDAASPPDDGFFDPQAAYLGAVRDPSDDWMNGEWMQWRDR